MGVVRPNVDDVTSQPLPDRWSSRDLPVLLETARYIDAGHGPVQTLQIAEVMGIPDADVATAWRALTGGHDPYLLAASLGASMADVHPQQLVIDLTERGRRAVGLWPSGESVDAFVEALNQAAEATEDPEEKTLLRRAAGAVTSVSRDIMVDVVAAVVSRQSGLG